MWCRLLSPVSPVKRHGGQEVRREPPPQVVRRHEVGRGHQHVAVHVGHPKVEDDVHGERAVRDPVDDHPPPLWQRVESDAEGHRDDAQGDQHRSEPVMHAFFRGIIG